MKVIYKHCSQNANWIVHNGPAWYKHIVMLVGGCYRGNIAMGGGHHGNSTVFWKHLFIQSV